MSCAAPDHGGVLSARRAHGSDIDTSPPVRIVASAVEHGRAGVGVMVDGVVPEPRPVNGRRLAGIHGIPGLRLTLGLPRKPASVGMARGVVDTALRAMEIDPDCRAELVLALSEACTNAVEHAVGADGYEVSVTFDNDCCVVEIVDAGRSALCAPFDLTFPDPTDERGRGLSIIAMSTDSLRLTPRHPHGLAVLFTKRLVGA